MIGSVTQRIFMLVAGLVILINICSSSISDITRVSTESSKFSSKKELIYKKFAQMESPDQLIDLEENNLEVEEKQEKVETRFFADFSFFIICGAILFEEVNGHGNDFNATSSLKNLPLFIVFENFRL